LKLNKRFGQKQNFSIIRNDYDSVVEPLMRHEARNKGMVTINVLEQGFHEAQYKSCQTLKERTHYNNLLNETFFAMFASL
jgi:hypothetical protein